MSNPLGSGGRIESGDSGVMVRGVERMLKHQPVAEPSVVSPADYRMLPKPVPQTPDEEIISPRCRFTVGARESLKSLGFFITKIVFPWGSEDINNRGFGLRVVENTGSSLVCSDLPRITEAAFDPRLVTWMTRQMVDVNPSLATSKWRAEKYGLEVATKVGVSDQEIAGTLGSMSETHEVLARFYDRCGLLPHFDIFPAERGGDMYFRVDNVTGPLGMAFKIGRASSGKYFLETAPVPKTEHRRENNVPRISSLPLIVPRGTID
ncbi:MAG TPA: hypothetical protein VJG66_04370 [Patescibacteria group bacterium]|nr:hypothetical protein [Patescibacteria group bacterium]